METSLAPGLLYAVPQMLDPNFQLSVVLLVEHTDEGAFGLVVNREIPLLLEAVCREQKIPYAGDPARKVRRGGPVQPEQGFVLFAEDHADPEGRRVAEGVQISVSRATLGRLCALPAALFECYLGYAGWGPEQLTREIVEGAWLTGPADAGLILGGSPETMWERGLRAIGIDPAALAPGGTAEA